MWSVIEGGLFSRYAQDFRGGGAFSKAVLFNPPPPPNGLPNSAELADLFCLLGFWILPICSANFQTAGTLITDRLNTYGSSWSALRDITYTRECSLSGVQIGISPFGAHVLHVVHSLCTV